MTKSASSTRHNAGEARPSPAEKLRRYKRFLLDARIAVSRVGQRYPLYGRTLGISEAGISALLAAELGVGESVHLEFALPKASKRLDVRAVIRNRTGARYGFEFLSLSEEQREAISDFRESAAE